MNDIKNVLVDFLKKDLENKILLLRNTIKETIEARNEETKSSAGDKFETGREMMQVEIRKNEVQLANTVRFLNDLTKIDLSIKSLNIEYGNVVITNIGSYFMCIPYGKIEVEGELFYSISFASPLGKLMKGRSKNDKFSFQSKEYEIIDII